MIHGVKDAPATTTTSGHDRAFAADGFEDYAAADDFIQRILADGAVGSITAAANLNALGAAPCTRTAPVRRPTPPRWC